MINKIQSKEFSRTNTANNHHVGPEGNNKVKHLLGCSKRKLNELCVIVKGLVKNLIIQIIDLRKIGNAVLPMRMKNPEISKVYAFSAKSIIEVGFKVYPKSLNELIDVKNAHQVGLTPTSLKSFR